MTTTLVELNNALARAISNVMTDEQLDAPVPANGGVTTRELLIKCSLGLAGLLEQVPTKDSANKGGRIKAYWHPHGYLSPRKPNAEWLPLVLD